MCFCLSLRLFFRTHRCGGGGVTTGIEDGVVQKVHLRSRACDLRLVCRTFLFVYDSFLTHLSRDFHTRVERKEKEKKKTDYRQEKMMRERKKKNR